jgi:hypothetical protein
MVELLVSIRPTGKGYHRGLYHFQFIAEGKGMGF